MKTVALVFAALFLVSCGKEETKYLFDKKSNQYQALQTLRRNKCEKESRILGVLGKTNNAEYWKKNFKVGTLFKSVQKPDSGKIIIRYFKVHALSSTEIEMILNSSTTSENSLIRFSLENGKEILGTIAKAVCNEPSALYSHSSLSSSSKLSISHFRKQGTRSKDYVSMKEEFTAESDLPILFLRLNGKITEDINSAAQKVTLVMNRDIKKVSKCSSDDKFCKDFPDVSEIPACDVSVNKEHPKDVDDAYSQLYKLEGADCPSL